MPFWRSWSLRVGLVDDPGARKIHAEPTSLAGGLAVMTGLILPLAVGTFVIKLGFIKGEIVEPLSYGLNRRAVELLAILSARSVWFFSVGWMTNTNSSPA